jgi:hypothetical protein
MEVTVKSTVSGLQGHVICKQSAIAGFLLGLLIDAADGGDVF